MGFLSGLSTVVAPPRLRASSLSPLSDVYYTTEGWMGMLSAAGVQVSADLALTLSAVYCAVTMIADDISTMPLQLFRFREDGGKDRVRTAQRGLGIEPYTLRWQPNAYQTAKDFFGMLVGHQLLRGTAYTEIVRAPDGSIEQLVPRHPDRVRAVVLPSGRLQFRWHRPDGVIQVLSQDQMLVFRDLTSDGVNGMSRIAHGMTSFGTALAAEKFAAGFFKHGATASLALIHKGGPLDEEQKAALHTSIGLYMGGVSNAGGFALLEDDITIEKLGVEPEKAQMMASREFSISEIARWFKIPGHKLEAKVMTQAYAAREAANLEYVIQCLRPIVVGAEQSIQRDLIDNKDEYFAEFLMDALLRGDTKARADYYRTAIQFGWMNRNEVRIRENMNPAPGLDTYLEPINMQGADRTRREDDEDVERRREPRGAFGARAAILAHEAALRVIRKEIAVVRKLAERHANDGAGWQAGLREFYAEHAGFVAQVLRLPRPFADAYVARHGLMLEEHGIGVMREWEWSETSELASLALDPPWDREG